jgi:hypothetical protein
VESGKGERPVDPFERAVAGLVLGGERYVEKIRAMLRSEEDTAERPSLRRLKAQEVSSVEEVEAAVAEIARNELPRRRRRLLLYALRVFSALPVGAIAKRNGRSPAAVTLAVRDLKAGAPRDSDLAAILQFLAERLQSARAVR